MKVFIYDNGANLQNYKTALKNVNVDYVFSKDVSLSSSCNALLLTGGGNIIPYLYGQPKDLTQNYDAETDLAEAYLLRQFVIKKQTVVGICKGMQVINVFFGGTLKATKTCHFVENKDILHPVILTDDSFLKTAFTNTFIVNSCHKEEVDIVPKTLVVSAISKNGNVVEALRHKTLPIYGVQFHPERMGNFFSNRFYSTFFKPN